MADIKLSNIGKFYGKVEVIKGVDLEIKNGEFLVFVGPSGCGKSTLLRMIAGLESITSGQLHIDGNLVNEVPPKERGVAMVFQTYALYPHMTVQQNLEFGMKISRMGKQEMKERIRKTAETLQITPLLDRLPKQLSGGQRQRVAIGRAIVRDPKVFLFDEPLSNLDASLRVQMRIEIATMHDNISATMVYVTHDQVEAMTLADRIAVLNGGKLEQVGTPLGIYHNPRNIFVAQFIGSPSMNIMAARVVSVTKGAVQVALNSDASSKITLAMKDAGLKKGDKVSLGYRPQYVTVSKGPADLQGEVLVVEDLGEVSYCHVRLKGGDLLISRAQAGAEYKHGSKVNLKIDHKQCHLFDEKGESLIAHKVPKK